MYQLELRAGRDLHYSDVLATDQDLEAMSRTFEAVKAVLVHPGKELWLVDVRTQEALKRYGR